MAYKSLYRKYRPNNFEEVCGQEHIIKTLKNALSKNKISHAYLFTGVRGTGKTTIAKIFAKNVNCMDIRDGVPCGLCEICKCDNTDEIQDIIEIDAASNNGVDEIRELKNKIKLVPSGCKYKVYIIDEVHMLSTGAFNALLKTLEEPPSHVIFILATTEPQKLPITIISRCQRFDFKKISIDEITNRLNYISKEEGIKIEKDAVTEIAKLSDGALRDAIGLLEQVSSFSGNEITVDDIYLVCGSISYKDMCYLIECYINRETEKAITKIEEIYVNGKDFSKIVENMLVVFRNMMISKTAKEYFNEKDIAIKDWIIKMASNISDQELADIIERIELLSREIKLSNYPRILFELLFLKRVNSSKLKDNKKEETIEKKQKEQVEVTKKEQEEKTSEKPKQEEPNSDYKIPIINNTISLANNNAKKDVQEILVNLDKYIVNKRYKTAATILKDSNVVAASEDHILLTYKYESMVKNNDKEIQKIMSFFDNILGKNIKVAAITDDDWKIKRPYYIDLKNKNGKIELIEELEVTCNNGGGMTKEEDFEEVIEAFGNDLIEVEV
jgi:DNA polymerase-3 subunit gamma/tau